MNVLPWILVLAGASAAPEEEGEVSRQNKSFPVRTGNINNSAVDVFSIHMESGQEKTRELKRRCDEMEVDAGEHGSGGNIAVRRVVPSDLGGETDGDSLKALWTVEAFVRDLMCKNVELQASCGTLQRMVCRLEDQIKILTKKEEDALQGVDALEARVETGTWVVVSAIASTGHNRGMVWAWCSHQRTTKSRGERKDDSRGAVVFCPV